jgi:hypothetical protein
VYVRPECGCVTGQQVYNVPAGKSQRVELQFDSTDFMGKLLRKIYVVSNDPEKPTREIDVTTTVVPTYRFLTPDGPVIVAGDKQGVGELYLTFNDIEPFSIKDIQTAGPSGDVAWEDWSGSLPDPAMNEAPRTRKGYKLTVTVPSKLPPGRSPMTIFVTTESPDYPVLQTEIYVQKGIVAIPDELYLGEMSGPKTGKFVVSRPGKNYKILGATSSSPNLKVTIKPGENGQEWICEVAYDGKSSFGEFNQTITLRTDDPKQPTVKVPVLGNVQ